MERDQNETTGVDEERSERAGKAYKREEDAEGHGRLWRRGDEDTEGQGRRPPGREEESDHDTEGHGVSTEAD